MFSMAQWVLGWMVPFAENYLWFGKEYMTEHSQNFFVNGGPVNASMSSELHLSDAWMAIMECL